MKILSTTLYVCVPDETQPHVLKEIEKRIFYGETSERHAKFVGHTEYPDKRTFIEVYSEITKERRK